MDAKKLFDVLALIEKDTQQYTTGELDDEGNKHDVPESAALRLDLGNGQHEEMTETEEGWFPGAADYKL